MMWRSSRKEAMDWNRELSAAFQLASKFVHEGSLGGDNTTGGFINSQIPYLFLVRRKIRTVLSNEYEESSFWLKMMRILNNIVSAVLVIIVHMDMLKIYKRNREACLNLSIIQMQAQTRLKDCSSKESNLKRDCVRFSENKLNRICFGSHEAARVGSVSAHPDQS